MQQKKWEETVITDIPTNMNFSQYTGEENLTPQQDSVIKPEKLYDAKQGSIKISPGNSFGLPLLHVQFKSPYVFSSATRATITVPQRPVSSVAEERKCPQLSLLHSCLSAENMVINFCAVIQRQNPTFFAT